MTEIKNKPVWWPKNPYKSDNDWHRKSDTEKFWDEGSEDCWDACCEQLKPDWMKKKTFYLSTFSLVLYCIVGTICVCFISYLISTIGGIE